MDVIDSTERFEFGDLDQEMRCHLVVLDPDGTLFQEVNPFLRQNPQYRMTVASCVQSKEQVGAAIAANKPECVVFDANSLFRKRDLNERLVTAWRRLARTDGYPGPGIVAAVTVADSSTEMGIANWLNEMGVRDGVRRPAGQPDLITAIEQAVGERDKVNSGDVVKVFLDRPVIQRGVSYSLVILAGKGGSGKTFLTANIGALLAFAGDQKVCVVDYSDTLPALAETLGVRRRVRGDLTDQLPGLQHLLVSLMSRHGETLKTLVREQIYEGWKPAYHRDGGQLDCLFGHGTIEHQLETDAMKARLTEQLKAVLRTLRSMYDTTVVDTGDWLLSVQHVAAYREADLVLIPVPPQEDAALATSHFVWDLFQAMEWDQDEPQAKVALVVNGMVPGGSISERRLKSMMPPGVETWGTVEWDPEEVGKAFAAKSLPVLFSEKSSFARALAGIVDAHIAPLKREEVKSRGGLFSKIKQLASA